ncbi:MAG: N-acetylneuraminate synthase family protein [Salinispira sp.]
MSHGDEQKNAGYNPQKVQIVAEIGSGHTGDIPHARELIHAAVEAGADLIKFQHFYADEILHPRTGNVDLPSGNIDLFQRFRELETSADFLFRLKESCTELGGVFFCSPFGLRSAADLLEIGERSFKIASPELNHLPLLRFLSSRAESLVLSTGVSFLGDIEEALGCIRQAANATRATGAAQEASAARLPHITLLHCVTAYPAPASEYNLRLIPNLGRMFGLPIGISDHSRNPVLVPSCAVLLGAVMVEKHFTLNRSGEGLDDAIALSPAEFSSMVDAVREAEQIRNSPNSGSPTSSSASPTSSFGCLKKQWAEHSMLKTHDSEELFQILGKGSKYLAHSERANYRSSRRSIHLREARKAGHVLQRDDMLILRTEKNLITGLHPRYFDHLIGCRLTGPVAAGEGIVWQDVLDHRRSLPLRTEFPQSTIDIVS